MLSKAIRPLSRFLGGEVLNVDVREMQREMQSADFLKVVSEYGVLVFRNQEIEPENFAQFCRYCGELEFHLLDAYRMKEHPEIYVISNIEKNGVPIGNPRDGFGWHTDQSYLSRPTSYTLLYGVETPAEGADTLFVDMVAALERLEPKDHQFLIGKMGIHSFRYMKTGNSSYISDNGGTRPLSNTQLEVADVLHPLIRTNPVTGRRGLYIGGDCLLSIDGMREKEAQTFIRTLREVALHKEHQVAHKWQPRDLVIWDNRNLMHTATEYDRDRYRRHIWRVSVRGEIPF